MYVKVGEAAELLSVKDETIRRYIRSGLLKAVKINKHYLIKRNDITEFMQSNLASNLDISKDVLKDILNQVDNIRNNHPEEIDRIKKEREDEENRASNINDVFNKLFKDLVSKQSI